MTTSKASSHELSLSEMHESDDDGWQVVKKSSSPSSSSSSLTFKPLTKTNRGGNAIESVNVSEPETTTTSAGSTTITSTTSSLITPSAKRTSKKKKQIYGTDEFQPVVSKRQQFLNQPVSPTPPTTATSSSLSSFAGPNSRKSGGVATASFFDLLQGADDEEDTEEIVGKILQERERYEIEAAALVLKQEQDRVTPGRLPTHHHQKIVEQTTRGECTKAAEENKIPNTDLSTELSVAGSTKKKNGEELEKTVSISQIAQSSSPQVSEEVVTEQVSPAGRGTADTRDDTCEDDDDDWQQQSKSKKGRKIRTSRQQFGSAIVDSIQTNMSIYLLEQDLIAEDVEEDDHSNIDHGQRNNKRSNFTGSESVSVQADSASSKSTKANSRGSKKTSKSKKEGSGSVTSSAASSPVLTGRGKMSQEVAPTEEPDQSALTPKLSKRNRSKKTPGPLVDASSVKKDVETAISSVSTAVETLSNAPETRDYSTTSPTATNAKITSRNTNGNSMVDKDGPSGMVNGVVSSIFDKGINPGLVKAMNVVFAALFCSLIFLIYASEANGHVLALTGIAIGLFVTVQWFINEMETMRTAEVKEP